jgi:hypothetical protein
VGLAAVSWERIGHLLDGDDVDQGLHRVNGAFELLSWVAKFLLFESDTRFCEDQNPYTSIIFHPVLNQGVCAAQGIWSPTADEVLERCPS